MTETATTTDVAVRGPTKLDQFFGMIVTARSRVELEACLPQHVPLARFEQNLKNALMTNPKLLDLSPPLVWREVAKAATLGLLLDPILGEAAIVINWNGSAKREEPQLRTMVRGLQKLARQSGEVTLFYPHEVCVADTFKCVLGDDKKLIHETPPLGQERGPVVGYYAVVKYANGERDFEVMTQKQIAEIRDRSSAWQAFQSKRIRSTPWQTDHDEMAKKTVMRRLMKRMPQSPDTADALAAEDRLDYEDAAEIAPVRPTALPAGAPPRPTTASHPAHASAPAPVVEVDPVSGEVHQPPADDPETAADAAATDDAYAETAAETAAEDTAPSPAGRVIDLRNVEGSRGLDWPAFITEFTEELNLTTPDAVDDLVGRHAKALGTLEKQAKVLHHGLMARINDRRASVPQP